MSILRPQDPTLPPDPLGSKADIHLTAATQTVTLFILIVLNDTVFRHGGAPADIAWMVTPIASYLVSVTAGRCARKRLLTVLHRSQGTKEAEKPVQEP